MIEKHLRSLEALGEDANSKMLVSLILPKLPKDVLIHLTDQKPDGQEWTVELLREKLHRYITNRENEERQSGIKSDVLIVIAIAVSIVKENIGVMNARNLPLWQSGKKRSKDAVIFV